MNNFTKTEALPKTGHVNEVCKEWLVREDGALAYKLQSQEINHFYKGNRFRNAVVREDFPVALHEQIKEKENAEKQTEFYRRKLNEQEEHDKRIAKEIANKLERDLQEQQQREQQESEIIAQQMQEIYVNMPPPPQPVSRDKFKPPPRPAKTSFLQQNSNEATTSTAASSSSSSSANSRHHQQQRPQQPLQQQHFNNNITNSCLHSSHHSAAHVLKLSPEKYDQLVGNDHIMGGPVPVVDAGPMAERHMQQHANDIELYVDPCDYASLKEIGLPMEEIKEMSKKIKQEQKDELLARRLQDMEANDGLTQEERDRLMAIEAQDKELAKMLQEREKAKAKRAKEKARQRKSQQRDNGTTNSLHCGPLLPLPQDCMASSKHSKHAMLAANNHDDMLDMEAYSNPIDLINQQKIQNGAGSQNGGSINGGSLTCDHPPSTRYDSENCRDDDIYTLPVDNCRPGQRPSSLNIVPETVHISPHNSMARSENYSLDSHDSQNSHDVSPRMNYNKTGSFDQSSSPTPPYMPIQGTRRSNSSEERKKKSKDKCTHQ